MTASSLSFTHLKLQQSELWCQLKSPVLAEQAPGGAEGGQRCSESRGKAPVQPGEETGQHGAQTPEPREGASAGTGVTGPGVTAPV